MGCSSSKGGATSDARASDVKVVFGSPTPRFSSPTSSEASPRTPELSPSSTAQLREAVAKAALAIATAARAHLARKRVDRMRRPCSVYQINMAAGTFGECQCGWAKAVHSASALTAGRQSNDRQLATKLDKRLTSEELHATFAQRKLSTCVKYEVNMQSINFGECKCGAPKADHSTEALAAGDKTKAAAVDSPTLRASFVQREKVQCTMYAVNLQSGAMGECMHCGFPRAVHTDTALRPEKADAQVALVDGEALRATFVQKETAECLKFEVRSVEAAYLFGV